MAIAALLLLVATPLMLAIALVVRFTSRGPAVYVQQRIGLDRRNASRPHGSERRRGDLGGRPFAIYKFRTMYHGAGRDREVWTQPNDNRITRVGGVLRAYRIDELPQLLNVLKGEMNLVGPRPEQPKIFAHLSSKYEAFQQRQKVRPGITGLAQVSYRYVSSQEDAGRRLVYDLLYVNENSILLDLWILARTVPVVLLRRGAR